MGKVVSSLHRAVLHGQHAIVQFIIEHNQKAQPHTALTLDGTALHLAAWMGNPEMIGLLLAMGADVNISSSHCTVEGFSDYKVSRELQETSIVDIPWKYKQKSQEYTP